ncbi:hypothetical protein [Streptomyces cavernicola]|uniref:Uncharacterized protein n=1 Tax=Streptomyces cavernicola TaxID=3043613 RepID=A0ABT6SDZ1_9ACTN|nr:hypothetical protein [Streptomyces sp. B-S-A6]MDI3406054.1 hypothetical protein [Streptomyces sp. B-S-A6]
MPRPRTLLALIALGVAIGSCHRDPAPHHHTHSHRPNSLQEMPSWR